MSYRIQSIIRLIDQIRDCSVDVLIEGESGTGKELVAKALHHSSPRAKHPFVAVNCAALPDNLVESELFGIEKRSRHRRRSSHREIRGSQRRDFVLG